jgi:anaerobic selenocysteine-containing dehydrogenase
MTTTHRTCPLCEAHCGITVETNANDTVVSIRGDELDPHSRGYLCPKAYGLKGLHEDPDRLRRPLVRVNGEHREVDWDVALAKAAEGLAAVRTAHGPDALATYVGNPTAHDLGSLLYLPIFAGATGSKWTFSAASCDQIPKNLACQEMFGGEYIIPVPDIDHTDYLLVLGANPAVSNGSLLTAPNLRGRLKAIRDRGGRVVVVDPRRSETAELANEHHFIRPGADAAFLLAIVHVLFDEGLASPGRLADETRGLDEAERLAATFPPERVAQFTGIESETIRVLAREFAAAPTAACYGRLGTCTQRFGTLASWAVDVLNVVSGNLDRKGGAMFANSAAPFPNPPAEPHDAPPYGRWHTRVRGLPEVGGQVPAAALAEEIEGNGEERIRGLYVHMGNPVLSTPNGERLAGALDSLDFLVCHDLYLNETSRHADVILPSTSPLERSNADVFFYPMAARNGAHWSPAAVDADPELRDPWQILLELSARLSGAEIDSLDEVLCRGLAAAAGVEGDAVALVGDKPGPERLFDLLLRSGPYTTSLAELDPHGSDFGALEPRIPEVLRTASGKIELAPARIMADLDRLVAAIDETPAPLVLIGRREVRSNNSWMHNVRSLAKGRPRCILLVHPVEAARQGLESGDTATLRSRTGKLRVPVEVSDSVMPGVVCLPHGFGHGRSGTRMGIASQLQPGASANALSDDQEIDILSGNAVLNGIPVTLEV